MNAKSKLSLLAFALLFNACHKDAAKIDMSHAFPKDLAIASPLHFVEATASLTKSTSYVSHYEFSTDKIAEALSGGAMTDLVDARFLYSNDINADCYGPALTCENHPDDTSASTCFFPSGDLGLWLELNDDGNACAAAQLNAKMSAMEDTFANAMLIAATLISVADNAEKLPEAGESSNIESELAAFASDLDGDGVDDVSWDVVTIAQSESETWSYALEFVYTNPVSSKSYPTKIVFEHSPSESSSEYSGLLWFSVSGDSDDFQGGNCPETERTRNGTLEYTASGDGNIRLQARLGTLCGADVDGRNTSGVLDETNTYSSTNANGWSENFGIFSADFDATTLDGSYVYAWQAGPNDSHSRVFNIGVNYHSADNDHDAEAYFGFSSALKDDSDADGVLGVEGFICNWAGPGQNQTHVTTHAQRQFISYNSSTGLFDVPSAGSNITYAPTNSCSYDGSGSFVFDTDADGDLGDEAGGAVASDLYTSPSTCTDTDIFDVISNCRNFTLPVAP
ncbi:MAG: hypothetical protein QGI45_08395 [Myxococcota bacterium]|jgi:hypothetical protein|nr:hypothetical protein [Myxococcota bacterium]